MLSKAEQEFEDAFEKAFAESGGEDEHFYFDLGLFPDIAKSAKHKKALEERAKQWGTSVRKTKGQNATLAAVALSDNSPYAFPIGYSFYQIMNVFIDAHVRERMVKAAKEDKFLRFHMMSPTRKKTLFKF